MKSIVLAFLAVSLMFTGCIFEEQKVVENETIAPPPPPPPPKPTFSITAPLNGEVFSIPEEGGEVSITLSSQNLILKTPGGLKKAGEGYFKISVNGEKAEVSSKVYTIPVEPGEYTVEVELMNNDRTSYSPKITKTLSFSVQLEEPEEYVPQEHTVTIKDFSYEPNNLTIKVSDKVMFINEGAYPRSATCFVNGKQIFDTGVIGPGAKKTINTEIPFNCSYYSTTHRAMVGSLIAESIE